MNENETPTPKTRTLDPEIAKLRTEHRAKVEAFRLQNASAVLLDSIKEKLSDGKLILEHRERLLDDLISDRLLAAEAARRQVTVERLVADLPVMIPKIMKMRPGDAPFLAHFRYDDIGNLLVTFG